MSVSGTNNSSEINWALVDSLTDEMIDRSEVPPLDESFFARAVWRMPEGQAVVALHKAIIEDFAAHWVIGGVLVYASASGENPGAIDANLLADLGIAAHAYDKLPDVVLHDPLKNRLFLVESITSHGPVDEQRRVELARLFSGAHAHLILRHGVAKSFHDSSIRPGYRLGDRGLGSRCAVAFDPLRWGTVSWTL